MPTRVPIVSLNGSSQSLPPGDLVYGTEKRIVRKVTLTGTDVTNQYYDLPDVPVPGTLEMYPKTGNHFFPDDNYIVISDGSQDRRVIWNPNQAGVDEGITSFSSGDKVIFVYSVWQT